MLYFLPVRAAFTTLARSIVAFVMMALCVAGASQVKSQPVDWRSNENWDPRYFASEVPPIRAMASGADAALYVGGRFQFFADTEANGIVKWDGTRWSVLGTGLEGWVREIATDARGNVYVLGSLTVHGTAANVAHWDGDSWSSMGTTPSPTHDIAVNSEGSLYVGGGYFTSEFGSRGKGLLRWNGNGWTTLIEVGVVNHVVTDANGHLYAFGFQSDFSTDASVWEPSSSVGVPIPNPGRVLDATAGPDGGIIVAVRSEPPSSGVRRWNGFEWKTLGSRENHSTPVAVAASPSGEVFVAREHNEGLVTIERWDGARWNITDSLRSAGQGAPPPAVIVSSMEWFNGDRVIGGHFRETESGIGNLVGWDGTRSVELIKPGWGANGPINAFASDDDGNLYAGGQFTRIGGIKASNIARWDGVQWWPVGDLTDGYVAALEVAQDGSLFAGGRFRRAGAMERDGIARWDGRGWAPLGDGLRNPGWQETGSARVIESDEEGRLYVAGLFTQAGDIEVDGRAIWDGERWQAFGNGLDPYFSIRALAVLKPDSIYAGGSSTPINGRPAEGVAYWDGEEWSVVGGGMTYPYGKALISSLLPSDGKLIAGGLFYEAGGVPATHLAEWDGDQWRPLATEGTTAGPNSMVRAVSRDEAGRVFIAGGFQYVLTTEARRVAMWDGAQWHALGAGISGTTLDAVAVDARGDVFFGGSFDMAGTTGSANIARWISPVDDVPVDDVDRPRERRLSIYPNPFTTNATVAFRTDAAEPVRISLYDLLGRERIVLFDGLFSADVEQSFALEASRLPAGVYVIRVVGASFRYAQPVVHVR